MAKRLTPKSKLMAKISERSLRAVLAESDERFPSSKLARVMAAIIHDKPIPPPDAKGWDAAALLITAAVLVTRAAAIMGKAEASHGRRAHKKVQLGRRS
jgi:hypothetical protein